MALPYAVGSEAPVIHTLITSALPPDAVDLLRLYSGELFSAVSNEVAGKFSFLKFAGIVYNGCDTESFTFSQAPGDYFLSFGRIEPGKAVDKAVRAAAKAGIKLKIAGSISDQGYFEEKIKPYLGERIAYIGVFRPKDFGRKVELIQGARAVFCLTESGEGFSNTMMEALACGAPVIASPLPSFKAIIRDGSNGFIVQNEQEILESIGKIRQVERWQCRQTILDNYTTKHMVDGYFKLYEKYARQDQ